MPSEAPIRKRSHASRVLAVCIRLFRLPLDFILLSWDVLAGLGTIFSGVLKRKPRPCPYCCRNPNPDQFPRPCSAAEKYGNWWMLKLACPCLQGPTKEVPAPHCNRKNPLKWRIWAIPLALALLGGAWIGIAMAAKYGGREVAQRMAAKPDPVNPESEPAPEALPAEQPEGLLAQGRALYKREKYQQARIAFLNAAQGDPTNAVYQLEIGRCLFKEQRYPAALGHMLQAEKLDSSFKPALVEIADLYYLARRHDKVVEYLEKARGAWTGDVERGLKLAQAYVVQRNDPAATRELDAVEAIWKEHPPESGNLLWAGRLFAGMNQSERATQLLQDAVKRHPNDIQSHIGLAALQLSRGKVAEAEQALARAAELDPDSPALEIQRAERDLLVKGLAAGIERYRKFVDLHPDRFDVKERLAGLLIQARRYDEAIQIADQMADSTHRNESLKGLAIRARICFERRMFSDAILTARKALALDESEPGVLFLLAQSLYAQEKYQQAVAELHKVCEIAPDMEFAHLLLARAQNELGLTDGSRETFTRTVQRFPKSDAALLELANFYYLDNHPDRARKCYETLLNRNPRHYPAANNLAQILADLGEDLDRAYELAADLFARQPGHPLSEDLLGWVLFRQGKTDLALPHLRKAVRGLPSVPAPRYHLGAALIAAGKTEEGRRELETALTFTGNFAGADRARELLAGLDPPEGAPR